MMLSWVAVAFAHQPHDPVYQIEVSPAFGTDHTALALRYPDQNWRSLEVVKSTDGGVTWVSAFRGLGNATDLAALRLSPKFDQDGVAFVTTQGEGAWVTTDGAATWHNTLPGMALGAGAVSHDGAGPVLLAVEVAGPMWRSTDLGVTWEPGFSPGPVAELEVSGADVAAAAGGYVFQSHDAGLSFDSTAVGGAIHDLAIAPGVVVLAGPQGLAISEDGAPFTLLAGMQQGAYTVGVSPTFAIDHTIVSTGLYQGVFVSEDGGATFVQHETEVALSNQSPLHFYSFRFSGTFSTDGTLFLNSYEGLLVSRDRGLSWVESDTRPPGLVNAMEVSPDFATDRMVVVSSYDGGVWVSTDAGETFTIHNNGLPLSSIYDVDLAHDADGSVVALAGIRSHVEWGSPPFDVWETDTTPPGTDYTSRVALSPDFANDGAALVGTRASGLLRTDDHGGTWSLVVDGNQDAVSAIAWSPDTSTVLLGFKGGRVLRSTDGGTVFTPATGFGDADEPVWIDVDSAGFLVGTGAGLFTTPDGAAFTPVDTVSGCIHQVSTTTDGTRFAVVRGGGLFRSDAGGPYTEVGTALTAHGSPHELAPSPSFADDGTLFASIDDRLFRSVDRGDTWTELLLSPVRYEEDAQAIEPHDLLLSNVVQSPEASVTAVTVIPPGSFTTLAFTGTGVTFVGATREDLGEADVELDGAVVGHFSQTGAEQAQVEQFRQLGMAPGLHTIRVTPTTDRPIVLDFYDVYRELGDPTDTGTGPDDTGEPPDDTPSTDSPATDGDDDVKCGCETTSGSSGLGLLLGLSLLRARGRTGGSRTGNTRRSPGTGRSSRSRS